jgi:hypothetical protein
MTITNVNSTDSHQTVEIPPNLQSYYAKWKQLDFDLSLMHSSPDFVKFMIDTGLAFTVAGYYHSLDHTEEGQWDVPILIQNGEPHLMCEGRWTPWSTLKHAITYNKNEGKFISIENPMESWTYVCPDGFIKKDSNAYEYPFPIFRVSKAQHKALKELASQFFHQRDGEKEKDCILQFHTSPVRPFQEHYRKNFHWATSIHSGVRLITNNRDLFSFGISGNQDQIDAKRSNGSKISTTALATATAYIKMLDNV